MNNIWLIIFIMNFLNLVLFLISFICCCPIVKSTRKMNYLFDQIDNLSQKCKNKARDNSIRCELEACNRIDCIECDWISYYESYVRWDVGRRVLYKKFVQEVVQWKRCKSSKWDTSTIREGRVLRRISVEVIQMQRFQEFN
jgi:hypothetical protein